MSFFKKHSSPQHSVSRIKTWALNWKFENFE
jgi:hypothetical protein